VYRLNLQSERANRELLELMVKAIEARDPYTSGHSRRVATYAVALGREIGLHTKEMDQVEIPAVLHDVGKIYEEFAPILRKQGRLTPEEFALMKTHPIRSFDLVRTISSFRGEVERSVRHHHENYDGSGYPDSVSGDSIPLGARIIRIADTVDAMTTDRSYRKALGYEQVSSELRKYAGTQFDPRMVEAFSQSVVLRGMLEGKKDLEDALGGERSLAAASASESRVRQGALQTT